MSLKKTILSFLLAFFVISGSALAGRDDEPIYSKDEFSVSAWGYSYFSGNALEGNFMSYPTRGRVKIRNGNWIGFVEMDFSHLLQENAPDNPVTQLWVGYDFGKEALFGNMFRNTIVRFGSVLTGAGQYIGPAYMGITAVPPMNTFGSFGNGGQLQTEVIPGVTLTADVTGRTGVPFHDWKGRTSRVEMSERVDWVAKKSKTGKPELILSLYNATGGGENSYQKNAFSMKYSPIDTLDLYAGAFQSKERVSPLKTLSETGGYALADYELYKVRDAWLVPDMNIRAHAMFEKASGWKDYTGYTGGLSFILSGKQYRRFEGSKVVVDYMKTTTQIEGGPKVNDNPVMLGILVFF